MQPLQEYWRIENGQSLPEEPTAASSSLGVCPIQKHYGDSLQVACVRLFAGSYDTPGIVSVISHMLTFDNVMRVSVEYSMPSVDRISALLYGQMQQHLIHALLSNKTMTVRELLASFM